MAQCVSFSKNYTSSKDNTHIDEDPTSPSGAHSAKVEFDTAETDERIYTHEYAEAERANSATIDETMGLPENAEPPQPLERGDQTLIRQNARALANSYYSDARVSRLNTIMGWVNGLTQGKESWWLHVSSNLSNWMVNNKARFLEWMQLYADDGTGTILNNDLASSMAHAQSRTQGELERLLPFASSVRKIAAEASAKLGRLRDTDDVLRMIGDWAIARHILEDNANEKLIEHWQRELNWLQSLDEKALAKELKRRGNRHYMEELERNIENLSDNLDNPFPPDRLASVGYTRAEAEALIRRVEDSGVDMELIRRGADELVAANEMLLQEDVKTGRISPDQLAALRANEFKHYVPVMSNGENKTGYLNDTHPYYPGSYRARNGKNDMPINAFTSTVIRARRVAGHIATRDIGDRLMVMALQNAERKGTDLDNGLRIISLAQLDAMSRRRHGGNNAIAEWAQRAKQNGGFVVDRPVLDENGNVASSYQALVYFDPSWTGKNGLAGAELNSSLLFNATPTPIQRAAIRATGTYGQLFTRFRPWFGLVNAGRDTMERISYMANRDYIGENGQTIHGHLLLAKFATNVANATHTLLDMKLGMRDGTFDMSSKYGQLWQEYVRYGVHQDYIWGSTGDVLRSNTGEMRNRTAGLPEYLKDVKNAEAKELYAYLKKNGQAALDMLDEVNDYWNNIASFAHYVTLREAGVPAERAARNVLDVMDFNQQGKFTNPLRIVFPFVKPIMQSASSLSRALGLSYDKRGFLKSGWKGWATAAALGLGFKMLAEAARSSMGRDEDGNWRIDQLSLSKLSRGIPFGIGDNGAYFFLNTGYSLPRLVATMVWGTDRVERGLLSPEALGGQMLLTFLQEMSPGNWPEFSVKDNPAEWIIQAITPAILSPLAEAATNLNSFGHVIKRGDAPEYGAKSDYGGGSSMKVYNKLAQDIRRMTGVDLYPEQVQHLIQGWTTGPFVMLRALWEDGTDPSIKNTQHYKDTHLNPWVEALGATMSFGYADDVARGVFNQAEARLIKIIKDNGIKKTDETAYKIKGSREDKRKAQVQWWYDQCIAAGLPAETAQDIQNYFLAADALKQGSKEINDYLRNEVYNGLDLPQIQAKMEEVTNTRRDVYRKFVNNLNMYRGQQR